MWIWRGVQLKKEFYFQFLSSRYSITDSKYCHASIQTCISHQWEVVWINPHNTQVWILCVVSGHLLQNLQEFKTIWKPHSRSSHFGAAHTKWLSFGCIRNEEVTWNCTYQGPLLLQRLQCEFHSNHPPAKDNFYFSVSLLYDIQGYFSALQQGFILQ